MELDSKTFAILVVVFLLLVGWFLDTISDAKGLREAWKSILGSLFESKEYWEDIEREETKYDDEDDKTINGDR